MPFSKIVKLHFFIVTLKCKKARHHVPGFLQGFAYLTACPAMAAGRCNDSTMR
jgi:hypothetical protein